MLMNLSIRSKILLGFILAIVLSLSSSLYLFFSVKTVNSVTNNNNERVQDQTTAMKLQNYVGILYSNQADLIINNNAEAANDYEQNAKALLSLVSEVAKAADTGDEAKWAKELETTAHNYIGMFTKVKQIFDKQDEMPEAEVKSTYRKLDDETDVEKEKLYNLSQQFIDSYGAEFNEANTTLSSLISRLLNVSIASPIVIAIVSLLFAMLIARMISNPVSELVSHAEKIASGDLTVQLSSKSKDEIGQLTNSFADMTNSLIMLLQRVSDSGVLVSSASRQISSSAEEIAIGNTSQANAAQAMTELFKELSAAIEKVNLSAQQASELSQQTITIAQDGGNVVRESIRGMNHLNEQMSRLEEGSGKIGEIIEVIDDIASQTNLLALNAAIEAARAGEQGRGFAVVADEVRKLAERSSEATKQITAIIRGMQGNTVQSVKAVEESVVSSQQISVAFEHILSMVNTSNNKVTEIAGASQSQAAQASNVLIAIETISASTEEAAASSEETASAAQSLVQLAEELNNTVSVFKLR